jgi:hypothetical protein
VTKQIIASELGLEPHYKVRVVFPGGAILHLAARNEPTQTPDGWHADWIDDHRYGDTIGFIEWRHVSAVTWRWSP